MTGSDLYFTRLDLVSLLGSLLLVRGSKSLIQGVKGKKISSQILDI